MKVKINLSYHLSTRVPGVCWIMVDVTNFLALGSIDS